MSNLTLCIFSDKVINVYDLILAIATVGVGGQTQMNIYKKSGIFTPWHVKWNYKASLLFLFH